MKTPKAQAIAISKRILVIARNNLILVALKRGDTIKSISTEFKISPTRVSQIKAKEKRRWDKFYKSIEL